jgi:hypothetical protein
MQTAPPGFANWRTLFDYIKTAGMADEQRVELEYKNEPSDTVATNETPPELKPGNPVLYLDEIKARAFEEIYDLLPDHKSVRVMFEMLETASNMPGVGRHVKPVMEFLNKIPQRS